MPDAPSEASGIVLPVPRSTWHSESMDLLELPLTTEAAIAVLRIGMRQEAHLRKDWWSTGEWADTLIYGMLSSDRQTA